MRQAVGRRTRAREVQGDAMTVQMTTDQANDAPNFVDGESLVVFLAREAN